MLYSEGKALDYSALKRKRRFDAGQAIGYLRR
jgi:hypothetical protein